MGAPWLFRQAAAALAAAPIPPEPTLAEQKQLLLDHYGLVVAQFGVEKGTILMRKLAACYVQGRPRARTFRKAIAADDDARGVRRRGRGVPFGRMRREERSQELGVEELEVRSPKSDSWTLRSFSSLAVRLSSFILRPCCVASSAKRNGNAGGPDFQARSPQAMRMHPRTGAGDASPARCFDTPDKAIYVCVEPAIWGELPGTKRSGELGT